MERIKTKRIIDKLVRNTLADEEIMTAGQLRSAELLLKRTLPEIRVTESTVDVFNGDPAEITNAQLLAIIAGNRGRDAAGEKKGKNKPH